MKDASKHPLLDMFPELLNGVEYVNVGDVCDIHKGVQFNKSDMKEMGSYPVMNGGINPSGYAEVFNEDENTITISQGGASAGYVNFLDSKFWLGAHCYALKPYSVVMNRYLYHYIKQNEITLQQCQYGAGIPALAKSTISSLEIPLPPLPVQEAIVNILDRFAVYAAELQAELQARQQQYNYYRDTLLSFDLSADKAGGREDVQWKKLGEVCIYAKERIGANLMNENNYVSVENLLPNQRGKEKASNVPKEGNCIKFEPNDVLIGNIRPYLHKIWYADCVGGTNGDVLCVRIKDDAKNVIIPRYLYCILSSHSFFEYDNSYSKGAKMPRGDKQKVMEYEFGIPSLSEQQRIVDILDRFDTLVNDLSQGLPAEIEARQQQYEYYRDRLLTFKRKEE